MRALIALTTANQLSYTLGAIETILRATPPFAVDLIAVDDASRDGTPQELQDRGVRVIGKTHPAGLTDSWNLCYQEFRSDPRYDALVIANNDILVPSESLERLFGCLEHGMVVGPLTTRGEGPDTSRCRTSVSTTRWVVSRRTRRTTNRSRSASSPRQGLNREEPPPS